MARPADPIMLCMPIVSPTSVYRPALYSPQGLRTRPGVARELLLPLTLPEALGEGDTVQMGKLQLDRVAGKVQAEGLIEKMQMTQRGRFKVECRGGADKGKAMEQEV